MRDAPASAEEGGCDGRDEALGFHKAPVNVWREARKTKY